MNNAQDTETSFDGQVMADILDRFPHLAVANANAGLLTTYRVGGAVTAYFVAESVDDLKALGECVGGRMVSMLPIGFGSNLLVADRGFSGLAVSLASTMSKIERFDESSVRVGARVSLPVLARWTVDDSLTGFEWAVGVPGTIGGAVRMNAGGHGSDMARSLERVRVVDVRTGDDRWLHPDELALGYRSSTLAAHSVVVEVELALQRATDGDGPAELRSIVSWRRDNQPGGHNAGSVFANPKGDSAGRLIDSCGLKGFRIGSASVSNKHANFIQADSGGTAGDVHAVMAHVRNTVANQTGVELNLENRLAGFSPSELAEVGIPSDQVGFSA